MALITGFTLQGWRHNYQQHPRLEPLLAGLQQTQPRYRYLTLLFAVKRQY
nr:hypothetical protein [Erwinia sp. Ejp617]